MLSSLIRLEKFLENYIASINDLSKDTKMKILENLGKDSLENIRRTCTEFRNLSDEEVMNRNARVCEWLDNHVGAEVKLREYPDEPKTIRLFKLDRADSWRIILNGIFHGHILNVDTEDTESSNLEVTFVSNHEITTSMRYNFKVINIAGGINTVNCLLNTLVETQWGGLSPGAYMEDGSLAPHTTLKLDTLPDSDTWPVVNREQLQELFESFQPQVKNMIVMLSEIETYPYINNSKLLVAEDHEHIQVCFMYRRNGQELKVRSSFHFETDSCRDAFFCIEFRQNDSIGFKYRKNINDLAIFSTLLQTDWSEVNSLDTYYSNPTP